MALRESLLHGDAVPEKSVAHEPDCSCMCVPLPFCNCIRSSRIGGNENVMDYIGDFCRHVWRGLSSDLSDPTLASPAEKKLLADKYLIKGQCAQNFLAWRRSGLFVMLIPLFVQFILSSYSQIAFQRTQIALKRENALAFGAVKPLYILFDCISWIAISLILVAILLGGGALHYWHHYRFSRRLVFAAWLCYFGGPFLVTLFPYRLAIDFSKIQREVDRQNITLPSGGGKALSNAVGVSIGAAFAAFAVTLLAPAALTLTLSISRTALTVRTLLPQSQIPAFVLRSVPLVTLPIFWLVFVVPVQVLGHPLLWIGILLYLGAPFEFLFFGKWIAPAMSVRLRFMYLGTNLVAIALVVAYVVGVLDLAIKIKPLPVVEFLFAFVAREVFHELNMKANHPALYADWLDRRTQIFEITGFKEDIAALAHEDKRRGTLSVNN